MQWDKVTGGTETSSCCQQTYLQVLVHPWSTSVSVPPWSTSVSVPRYPQAPPHGAGRPQDRDRTPGQQPGAEALSEGQPCLSLCTLISCPCSHPVSRVPPQQLPVSLHSTAQSSAESTALPVQG